MSVITVIDYDFNNEAARDCADWIMEQLGLEALTVDAFLEFVNGSGCPPYDWNVGTWVGEYFEWRFSPAWHRVVWEAWNECGGPAIEEFWEPWFDDECDPELRRDYWATARIGAIVDMVNRFMPAAFARACLAADWVAIPVTVHIPRYWEDEVEPWSPTGDASQLSSGAWLIDDCARDWCEDGDAVEVYPCGLAYRLGVAMPPAVA